jgi:diguanylate cyclase (GGDEF)-like protein
MNGSGIAGGKHGMENSSRTQTIMEKFDQLPSMPGVAIKLLDALQKPSPDLREIARLISSDATLAAKVLKVINSPLYGLINKITSIEQAIRLLGLNTVKNLSLSLILKTGFIKKESNSINLACLWKEALVGAISAKMLAERIGIKHGEDAFLLGLLENIGALMLANLLPDQYALVQSEIHMNKLSPQDAENRVFGFNHADIGAMLTRSWGLPETFHIPIKHHHGTEQLPEDCSSDVRVRTAILHLSSLYIDLITGGNMAEALGRIAHFINAYGFQDRLDAAEIGKELIKKASELSPIFDIDFRDESELDGLLDSAKQVLLNMSMQMVTDMIGKNSELESLRQQASRDALTQLHNYKAFCDALDQEIKRSARYKNHLSLVLADIDFFKKVNDGFGHPAGDQVLREVAQALQKCLRECDFVARYGGEEFAIILPETTIEDALLVAERMRKKIKSLEISYDGHLIRITMSFGAAGFQHAPPMSFNDLLKAADVALYTAKKQGRDSCCTTLNKAKTEYVRRPSF